MKDEFTRQLWHVWSDTYRLVFKELTSHDEAVKIANKAVKEFAAKFNEFGELKQETK